MPQLIEVPGYGEVEFPDGMSDDDIVNAIKQTTAPKRTTGQEVRRQVGLTVRPVVEAAAAIPLAAADAGIGARNLFTGANYDSASSMFKSAMDKIYGARETPLEEGVGIASAALAGSKIPVPTSKATAPQNFVRPITKSQQVLSKSQQAGYVVPPATTNPTAVNKTLEGVAGKLTTGQAASAKNQRVTTNLAARALGLAEDQPLTTEAIRGVRQQAAQGYEAVRSAGAINADKEFAADLSKITARYRGAAKDYQELAKSDVADIVKAIDKPTADADSMVDAIAILREKADEAFAGGKGQVGKAYKEASRALENLIERNLAGQGKAGTELLSRFREARKTIAKTYSVEKAFNASTGQVSGTKLGQQVAKGKPLSGELRTAGEFAQAFPKAAREFNESLPGISPLDFYAAGGTTAITNKPWYLLYPFLRQGTRNALLTPLGQRLAVPSQGGPVDPRIAAGLATGAGLIGQQ